MEGSGVNPASVPPLLNSTAGIEEWLLAPWCEVAALASSYRGLSSLDGATMLNFTRHCPAARAVLTTSFAT